MKLSCFLLRKRGKVGRRNWWASRSFDARLTGRPLDLALSHPSPVTLGGCLASLGFSSLIHETPLPPERGGNESHMQRITWEKCFGKWHINTRWHQAPASMNQVSLPNHLNSSLGHVSPPLPAPAWGLSLAWKPHTHQCERLPPVFLAASLPAPAHPSPIARRIS